jgi:hypothetical protein
MFPIYMRRGKLAQTLLEEKGNKLQTGLPLHIRPMKLTLLTVGASIACWTSTLVWIGSSHTLTTIVTRVKSNTQICLQLTVLSAATQQTDVQSLPPQCWMTKSLITKSTDNIKAYHLAQSFFSAISYLFVVAKTLLFMLILMYLHKHTDMSHSFKNSGWNWDSLLHTVTG